MKNLIPFSPKSLIFLTALLILGIASCKKDQKIDNEIKNAQLANVPKSIRSLNAANGLILYLPGNSGANDMSGNFHTATLTNVTTDVDHLGNADAAYYFNGTSSKITIADAADLNLQNTDYTISLWVRADNSYKVSPLLSKRGALPNVAGYMMGFAGYNKFQPSRPSGIPTYYHGTTLLTDDEPEYEYAYNFSDDFWHNYIIMYHQATGEIVRYFDGQLLTNEDFTPMFNVPSPDGSSAPLSLGFDQYNNSYFEGAISDIRIYNRMIDPQEIAVINGQTLPQKETEFDYTLNENLSPFIDGNFQVKMDGNPIITEYYSNFAQVLVPYYVTPYQQLTIQAFTQATSSSANPWLHLQVDLNLDGVNTTVFNQSTPAVPGASLTYTTAWHDGKEIYHILATTTDGP